MSDIAGKFVTAKLVGSIDSRQGAVISENPLVIKGESGVEYECEGNPVLVTNPPKTCIGCDLPLGVLCITCEEKLNMVFNAVEDAGLKFTSLEVGHEATSLTTTKESIE